MEKDMGKMCKCPHHKTLPMIAILFGLIFLLKNLGVFTAGFVDIAWPSLLIIWGLMKIAGGKCKCCENK